MKSDIKLVNLDNLDISKISSMFYKYYELNGMYGIEFIVIDNEIDNNLECTTTDILKDIEDFINNQDEYKIPLLYNFYEVGRVISCELITCDKKTTYGENYSYIKVKGYIYKNDYTDSLIEEIGFGTMKEISISFSALNKICSICNKSHTDCEHILGWEYEHECCYHIYKNLCDIYEITI